MMTSNIGELRKILIRKGYNEHEITPFFMDLLYYTQKKECRSKLELNAVMESLGWGISVIDEPIFKKIHSLIKKQAEVVFDEHI